MNEFEILDRNRDRDTGELLSFLVLEGGEPQLKRATSENILLYEHGMKEFLSGHHAVIVSGDDPEVIIAPTRNDMSYLIRVNGSTVETTPSQAADILESLKDAVEADNSTQRDTAIRSMVSVYDDIISSQVRRWLVRVLQRTFTRDEGSRINEVERGWVVDGFYLVDWNASVYTMDDDPDSDDYERAGGVAQVADRTYEFIRLSTSNAANPMEVTVNGDAFRLSEREMLFLSKVRFLLDRQYYHSDKPFWDYNDKLGRLSGVGT